MKLFGRKKKKNVKPTTEQTRESITKLRDTIQMLEKRETYLQQKIDAELINAKKNATKNKRSALQSLKKKKFYEQQIEKAQSTKMTLESQMMTLEGASMNLEVIKAMKQGGDTLRQIHGELDVDSVQDLVDDIQEQFTLAEEISDAISTPLGPQMDEDELMEELEELEQQTIEEQLLDSKKVNVPNLPSAPVHVPQAQAQESEPEDEDEDEIAKLKQSLNLMN
ncbi:charged multivesicular body protein 4c [Anaeramoeba ignava]|uniref:Charged multivesicular body protein 4c n=1 Tax=Anaeramoeba ignava TaxID=1746090 RepID=A0A9Q0LAV5_ANAIG|nr:charged multivesicular body protein 4c [Anaeramoeba ignava]